jgi:hypothetical protein
MGSPNWWWYEVIFVSSYAVSISDDFVLSVYCNQLPLFNKVHLYVNLKQNLESNSLQKQYFKLSETNSKCVIVEVEIVRCFWSVVFMKQKRKSDLLVTIMNMCLLIFVCFLWKSLHYLKDFKHKFFGFLFPCLMTTIVYYHRTSMSNRLTTIIAILLVRLQVLEKMQKTKHSSAFTRPYGVRSRRF